LKNSYGNEKNDEAKIPTNQIFLKKLIIKNNKKKNKSDKSTKPCDLNSEITNRMQTEKDDEIQF